LDYIINNKKNGNSIFIYGRRRELKLPAKSSSTLKRAVHQPASAGFGFQP